MAELSVLTTAVLQTATHKHDDGQEIISITTRNSKTNNKLTEYMDVHLTQDFYTLSQPTIKRCVAFMDNCRAKLTRRSQVPAAFPFLEMARSSRKFSHPRLLAPVTADVRRPSRSSTSTVRPTPASHPNCKCKLQNLKGHEEQVGFMHAKAQDTFEELGDMRPCSPPLTSCIAVCPTSLRLIAPQRQAKCTR